MLKITAIGNLTNDVELKMNETTGKPYAILRIASDGGARCLLRDKVSEEEIAERLKHWKRPEPKFKKGYLGLYCKLAASGDFETITFEDEPERQPGFLIKASEVEFLSPRKVEETAQELEDESVREVAA